MVLCVLPVLDFSSLPLAPFWGRPVPFFCSLLLFCPWFLRSGRFCVIAVLSADLFLQRVPFSVRPSAFVFASPFFAVSPFPSFCPGVSRLFLLSLGVGRPLSYWALFLLRLAGPLLFRFCLSFPREVLSSLPCFRALLLTSPLPHRFFHFAASCRAPSPSVRSFHPPASLPLLLFRTRSSAPFHRLGLLAFGHCAFCPLWDLYPLRTLCFRCVPFPARAMACLFLCPLPSPFAALDFFLLSPLFQAGLLLRPLCPLSASRWHCLFLCLAWPRARHGFCALSGPPCGFLLLAGPFRLPGSPFRPLALVFRSARTLLAPLLIRGFLVVLLMSTFLFILFESSCFRFLAFLAWSGLAWPLLFLAPC